MPVGTRRRAPARNRAVGAAPDFGALRVILVPGPRIEEAKLLVENLVEFEARLQDYANNKVLREKLAGYTDHWITGTRELLQIWS